MKPLTVYMNNKIVFEYDKDTELDDQRLAFLDRMDSDMDRGIKIQGELIANPDSEQRVKFIALNLIKALQKDIQPNIAASCAYLTNRRPLLIEIHANDNESGVEIELIEDKPN